MIVLRLLLAFFLGFVLAAPAQAAPPGFVSITPTKREITVNPGETRLVELTVESTLDQAISFELRVSDLIAGEHSLINEVTAPDTIFTLAPGQSLSVPIEIKMPATAYPGTRHGQISVVIKNQSANLGNAQAAVTTALNSLLFIRVPGEVKESGRLDRFGLLGGSPLLNAGERTGFYIAFHNDGNSYLNPYGLIKILNWRGRELGFAVIDPWYVLPGTTRIRDIPDLILPAGIYRATLDLNRGYDNVIDSKQIWFAVYPLWAKYLVAGIVVLLILAAIYRIIRV